eukprot:6470762-Amphidinium_carterae.1
MDSSSSDDSDEEALVRQCTSCENLHSGMVRRQDEGLCPRFYENAPLPSVGSASHGLGTCKRCLRIALVNGADRLSLTQS